MFHLHLIGGPLDGAHFRLRSPTSPANLSLEGDQLGQSRAAVYVRTDDPPEAAECPCCGERFWVLRMRLATREEVARLEDVEEVRRG